MIFKASSLKRISVDLLPFSDAVSDDLPLGQLLRLSLFQVSVGMAAVMLLGTLNRVMIVELDIGAMLVAAMISHLIHIVLYALAYYVLEFEFEVGAIEGPDSGPFNDAFYFSIVCYTTLGFGDIFPSGQLRLLSGIEALNGLVMITWTASMTYLHMERFWKTDGQE